MKKKTMTAAVMRRVPHFEDAFLETFQRTQYNLPNRSAIDLFNSFDLNFIANPFKDMAEWDSRMLDAAEKKVLQHRAAQTTETPIVHHIATPRVEPYSGSSEFGSAGSASEELEYFPEVVAGTEAVDQPAALPSEEKRRRREKQREHTNKESRTRITRQHAVPAAAPSPRLLRHARSQRGTQHTRGEPRLTSIRDGAAPCAPQPRPYQ